MRYGLKGSIQEKLDEAPPIPAIAAISGGMQQEDAANAAITPVKAAFFEFSLDILRSFLIASCVE
jgi:hypothetical protein